MYLFIFEKRRINMPILNVELFKAWNIQMMFSFLHDKLNGENTLLPKFQEFLNNLYHSECTELPVNVVEQLQEMLIHLPETEKCIVNLMALILKSIHSEIAILPFFNDDEEAKEEPRRPSNFQLPYLFVY